MRTLGKQFATWKHFLGLAMNLMHKQKQEAAEAAATEAASAAAAAAAAAVLPDPAVAGGPPTPPKQGRRIAFAADAEGPVGGRRGDSLEADAGAAGGGRRHRAQTNAVEGDDGEAYGKALRITLGLADGERPAGVSASGSGGLGEASAQVDSILSTATASSEMITDLRSQVDRLSRQLRQVGRRGWARSGAAETDS